VEELSKVSNPISKLEARLDMGDQGLGSRMAFYIQKQMKRGSQISQGASAKSRDGQPLLQQPPGVPCSFALWQLLSCCFPHYRLQPGPSVLLLMVRNKLESPARQQQLLSTSPPD
jgi:hypothetical protein